MGRKKRVAAEGSEAAAAEKRKRLRRKAEKRALAEQERRVKAQLSKQPEKDKFNIVEEFFICLACIFD